MGDLVERLEVSADRLLIVPGAGLRHLLAADPWIGSPPDLDLTGVPRPVLLRTAAYLLAPVAWAHGVRASLDGADTSLATALPLLHAELRRAYPRLAWDGEVTVADPVAVPPSPSSAPGPRTALTFSGGVDSTASALHHPDGSLVLITASRDDESGPPGRWEATLAIMEAFARAHGHRHLILGGNTRSFVPKELTRRLKPSIEHWWSQVSHSMALAAMAAPALWALGVERLLVAATDHPGRSSPWGSSARLDPLIGLGSTRVVHDFADETRLGKATCIVRSVGPGGAQPVRVCYSRTSDDRLNCGVCQKCLRTQAALWLAGGDPVRFGFPDRTASATSLTEPEWAAAVARARTFTIIEWQSLGAAARAADLAAGPPLARPFLTWVATLQAGQPPLGDPEDVIPIRRARTTSPARTRPRRPASLRTRLVRRVRRLVPGRP